MSEDLLKQRVTGATLQAYDRIIRDWVNEQIRSLEIGSSTITEARVNELIESALQNFDGGISEEEVRQIVSDAIAEAGVSGDPLLTVAGKEIHTVVEFRTAIGGDESSVLPSSIRFKNVKIFYTEDSVENVLTFKDSILWVMWEAATESEGRKLKFFGEGFNSIELFYTATEDSLATNPGFTATNPISTMPTTKEVQVMINSSTSSSLTEDRVQEMIDVSIGAAIADSY